ncbi:thioesterase family protein [Albibacillus kandeliae]|uniref:thioesterase family protein n=1 Tax=Albibacillus kandeliae TaxID=2174228 RepID=UPI000D685847|nr:thioesterase family protein [Albibacillus kandeliae]
MNRPFRSQPMIVKPEWIDYNGHLNMAYYSVLFDQGVDDVWDRFGLGPAYRDERKMTTYTAEFHIRYIRELHVNDKVTCSFQIVDYDAKRVHSYQELYHEDGWLAATGESLFLSIDQSGAPKVAPFPEDIMAKIREFAGEQSDLPRPDNAGRQIAILRK